MRTLNVSHTSAATPSLADARVAMVFDDGSCLLDTGARARRAISCLVEPLAGDRVLASVASDGACHVLHIVERDDCNRACLSVPGVSDISLSQSRIGIVAIESLELSSVRDTTITAASGTLSLNACNLFMTVSESIVEQARHYIGKLGQYLLDVRELLRLHGNDALITAARDVKVDAERISMG
ncbi:MAG TPA: DUF3540 domain-containing protein [Rhodocyclaceae bacterium]|nr:DUF3540 domain-containing protein [Rhodocyclaceae bacterium]